MWPFKKKPQKRDFLFSRGILVWNHDFGFWDSEINEVHFILEMKDIPVDFEPRLEKLLSLVRNNEEANIKKLNDEAAEYAPFYLSVIGLSESSYSIEYSSDKWSGGGVAV